MAEQSLDDLLSEIREGMKPFFDERRAVEQAECPSRLERLKGMGVEITSAGGNCPVQIEGTVLGEPFYFRARGDAWRIGIGGEPIGNPHWYHDQEYGNWPDAGWMRLHEAYDFLIASIERWKNDC